MSAKNNNPQSSPQSPNPTHIANMATNSDSSGGMSSLLIAFIVLATVGAIAGGIYTSGQANDLVKFVIEKYFKAEATAEEKALEKAGETKAEGFLSVQAFSQNWRTCG